MRKNRILVVDDDESLRWVTQAQLEQSGYAVSPAANGLEALEVIQHTGAELVITDLRMPGMSGLELLGALRAQYPGLPVIVVTAYGTVETAVEAMKNGAYDYITKPVNFDEMRMIVGRALEHVRLREEVRILRSNLDRKYGFENILGRSKALLHVLDLSARAAQTTSTVLIRGETGTGKELLARAIHVNSPRKTGAFVTINCGAIPRDLIESELFGHVRGSFTGAMADRRGLVEDADGGTLFLDEIGELPLELQVKLLRLVQYGELAKVGARGAGKVDVRVIAATHRNLQAMVEDGAFREDLYYRLSVIPLELPPLRERPEDIPELAEHFLARNKEKHGRPDLRLPPSLLPYFASYTWPGNVRELENIVERLVVLGAGDEITFQELPEFLRREPPVTEEFHLELPPQGISLESVEKALIVKALNKANWNQTRAARYLDISRKTLIYRMEKFNIVKEPAAEPEGHDKEGL